MHDPFAVNDVWFSQQTGIPPERVSERGASLIFGHPQGPTGSRLLGELLTCSPTAAEVSGCSQAVRPGDTGAAVVVRVGD